MVLPCTNFDEDGLKGIGLMAPVCWQAWPKILNSSSLGRFSAGFPARMLLIGLPAAETSFAEDRSGDFEVDILDCLGLAYFKEGCRS